MQAQQLYWALNAVKKESMIRVEADEVTYPLHIILRYAAAQSCLQCCANHLMYSLGIRREHPCCVFFCATACLC